MKHWTSKLFMVVLLVFSALASGCIVSYTPTTSSVSMLTGKSQTFSVTVNIGDTYWYVDGVEVKHDTTATSTYVYNPTDTVETKHTITVSNKFLGIIKAGEQTWSITVLIPWKPALSWNEVPALKYSGTGWYQGDKFDATRVQDPTVVKLDGIYYMLYAGEPFWNPLSVGLTSSVDGITYTRVQDTPVIDYQNTQPWCSFRVLPKSAFVENDVVKLFLSGNSDNIGGQYRMGVATSTDMIHWNMYEANPIVYDFRPTDVVKFKGNYIAYASVGESNNFIMTSSSDGLTNYSAPVNINVTGASVVSMSLVKAFVSPKGEELLLGVFGGTESTPTVYCGISTDGINFKICSDAIVWDKPITPQYAWIFHSADVMEEDGKLKFWFTVGDGHTIWDYQNLLIMYGTMPLPDWDKVLEANLLS